MNNVEAFFEDSVNDKKSVLKAIHNDMKYAVQLPKIFNDIGIDKQQQNKLQAILPTYTVGFLYVTAVDMLSRLMFLSKPKIGENKKYFTQCAINWFSHTEQESNALWNLRNSLIHTYNLSDKQVFVQFGSSKPVEFDNENTIFYLHAMYSNLTKSMREIKERLLNDPKVGEFDSYLEKYGFYITFKR